MTSGDFYKKISLLTGCLLISLAAISQLSPFQGTLYFSIGATFLFVVFTILVYHIGSKSVESPDKNMFFGVAISSIFLKLIMTLAILFSYQMVAKPSSKLYLLPFLLIYLVYTVFETSVLMKLAKSDNNRLNK